MSAENEKTTFTAAEVAELLDPLNQSIQVLQEENAALKKKLERMNEIFLNAQRARFGQSSEKKPMFCTTRLAFSTKRKRSRTPKRKSLRRKPLPSRPMNAKRSVL